MIYVIGILLVEGFFLVERIWELKKQLKEIEKSLEEIKHDLNMIVHTQKNVKQILKG